MNNFSLTNIITEAKKSLKLGAPLVAAEMIYAISSFIATAMVSHLGKYQMAANALGWGIYLVLTVFFIGIYCSVSILGAQSYGAKDQKGVALCFKQGLLLAIFCSLPGILLMWYVMPIFLEVTKQSPLVVSYATPFLRALSLSFLPVSIWLVMQQFSVAIGKTRIIMVMSILQVPLEILFYYLFIFGKFGFPRLELTGVGYAQAIAGTIVMVIFGFYIAFAKELKVYKVFHKWWHFHGKFFWELVRVGLPLGFLYCIELAFFAAIALIMGHIGTNTLAAYQISYQYLMVGLTFIFGMIQVIGIRVGHEVGRNNKEAVRFTTLVNLGIIMLVMIVCGLVFVTFPHAFISVDINIHDPKMLPIVNLATSFLTLVGILLVSESIRLSYLGALRSMKDTKFPVLASTIGFWCIAFTLGYLLAFKLHWGGIGVWVGMTVGLFVTGMILLFRFYYLIRKLDFVAMVTKS